IPLFDALKDKLTQNFGIASEFPSALAQLTTRAFTLSLLSRSNPEKAQYLNELTEFQKGLIERNIDAFEALLKEEAGVKTDTGYYQDRIKAISEFVKGFALLGDEKYGKLAKPYYDEAIKKDPYFSEAYIKRAAIEVFMAHPDEEIEPSQKDESLDHA